MSTVWRALQGEDVVFLRVDVWDERAVALGFIGDFNVEYPNGFDPRQSVAVAYGVRGIPETYVIDRDGRLKAKYLGPVESRELVELVQEAIDGN